MCVRERKKEREMGARERVVAEGLLLWHRIRQLTMFLQYFNFT